MSAAQSPSKSKLQRQNSSAVAVANLAEVVAKYPLDVVRTRFQVNDGRISYLPTYKNTAHALFTIARFEGLKGLYAGFGTTIIGSAASTGLYLFFYRQARKRYSNKDVRLIVAAHFMSAAEAGVITRLRLQTPLHQTRPYSGILQLQPPPHQNRPYYGFYDGLKTMMREEGCRALFKGIVPGLFLVSQGIIKFAVYEELRKVVVDCKSKGRKKNCKAANVNMLNAVDYAVLGGSSKVASSILTYPFQVIQSRLQQRPATDGIPRYMGGWHVVKETLRFEGFQGFYKGITPHLLRSVPLSSIMFIAYENVLRLQKLGKRTD